MEILKQKFIIWGITLIVVAGSIAIAITQIPEGFFKNDPTPQQSNESAETPSKIPESSQNNESSPRTPTSGINNFQNPFKLGETLKKREVFPRYNQEGKLTKEFLYHLDYTIQKVTWYNSLGEANIPLDDICIPVALNLETNKLEDVIQPDDTFIDGFQILVADFTIKNVDAFSGDIGNPNFLILDNWDLYSPGYLDADGDLTTLSYGLAYFSEHGKGDDYRSYQHPKGEEKNLRLGWFVNRNNPKYDVLAPSKDKQFLLGSRDGDNDVFWEINSQ